MRPKMNGRANGVYGRSEFMFARHHHEIVDRDTTAVQFNCPVAAAAQWCCDNFSDAAGTFSSRVDVTQQAFWKCENLQKQELI